MKLAGVFQNFVKEQADSQAAVYWAALAAVARTAPESEDLSEALRKLRASAEVMSKRVEDVEGDLELMSSLLQFDPVAAERELKESWDARRAAEEAIAESAAAIARVHEAKAARDDALQVAMSRSVRAHEQIEQFKQRLQMLRNRGCPKQVLPAPMQEDPGTS